jgi:predicted Zn-dependent peptidase
MRTLRRGLAAVLCVLLLYGVSTAQERFRKSPPLPDPLPELHLPSIESAVLSNGLTVAVVRKTSSPAISLQVVVLAGEADSPPKLPGVASVVAHMIGRGAELFSSAEIENRIESMGGELAAEVSLERTVFTFDVLEEDLDRALEILSVVFLRASFPEKAVDAVERTLYYDLVESQKDSEFVAKRQLMRHLFKGHPFRTATYNEEVIKNIAREDIVAFYDRYYRPNNTVLVLAGNMNLQTASRKVSHYFNTWTPRKLERFFLPPPAPNLEEQITFVDIPQAREVTIFLGNIIPPSTGPDHFPFMVLNQILGGTPGSRLFMNLRESKGYAYYAFSGTDLYKSCSVFWVRARVIPEAVVPSIREILREIGPAAVEKATSFEIEQAKSFLIGNFPLKNEALPDLAYRAAQVRSFNLGDDHWNLYTQNIILVNLERVLETARRVLEPPPVVVIAGSIQELANHIREFDKVDVYDIQGNLKWTINKGVDK